MFLVFRPTGDCVFLGKRLAEGWSAPPDLSERLNELFDKVTDRPSGASQDDFAIALEQGKHQPHVLTNWRYDESAPLGAPIRKLIIDDDVPRGTDEGI